jgi:hypothetical protein
MWSVGSISGSISDSSAGSLKKLIDSMIIVSCCIGISHLGKETLTQKIINYLAGKKYTHTSIWLSDKKPEEEDNPLGIVVEYGDYSQELECKLQIDDQGNEAYIKIEKDNVKYPYEDRGGIRYYLLAYDEFTNKLGSVAYAELSVEQENQINFKDFINKCAPFGNEQWIKENYNYRNHNCQHFSAYIIDKLKPKYDPRCIVIKDKSKKEGKKREDVFPSPVLDVLKTLK